MYSQNPQGLPQAANSYANYTPYQATNNTALYNPLTAGLPSNNTYGATAPRVNPPTAQATATAGTSGLSYQSY